LTLFLAAACLTTGIIDIIMAVQTISNLSLDTILSHEFSAEVISVFAVGAAGASRVCIHGNQTFIHNSRSCYRCDSLLVSGA
jgi:hypothetical protein